LSFEKLQLANPLLKAIQQTGYTEPTPIQQQAIPLIMSGQDILGTAQTGTGKTAAFCLPILHQLIEKQKHGEGFNRDVQVLILTPTRELAIQIAENLTQYAKETKIKHIVLFGGVAIQPQKEALRKKPQIVVATPGRLLDLIGQGELSIRHLEHFVLDEADRMLDMGFIHDIKKIIAQLPKKRQTLLFSATMPPAIAQLAATLLDDPARIEVTPVSSTAERITQLIYPVLKVNKAKLLVHLIKSYERTGILVFSRTKHGADRIVRLLRKANIKADAIHGDKSQNARQNALANFKSGQSDVLVATDIAARGIDIEEMQYVINYDLPNEPETYVHRIGRTGRAGASGLAWSFCDVEEQPYLKDIQKLIRLELPVETDHPYFEESARIVQMASKGQSSPAGKPAAKNKGPKRPFKRR
jgi:ATP-dependent RNA helicase RhlE